MRSSLLALVAAGAALAVPAAAGAQSSPRDPTAGVLASCMRSASRCYDVDQVQRAYGVDSLHRAGIDGRGTTVAIIMAPTPILADGLRAQSEIYGLPQADLTIAQPAGDPGPAGSMDDQVEPNLDVQAVHAMAPNARLLFLEVSEAAVGRAVLQDEPLARAIDYAVARRADVISTSFGGVERRYPAFRAALARAARAGVAIFAGSGDQGVTMPGRRGRTTFYPAADPFVTSVGGTLLTLDEQGDRLAPDVAWGPDVNGGASGGGVSLLTPQPAWQRGLSGVEGRGRNYPDISMLAANSGAFLVLFPGTRTPILPVGGTSVATPLLAGVTALARQQARRPLRNVNRALYTLARNRRANGIVDVVVGNNGYSWKRSGATNGLVEGYLGLPGYDLVTGLGTIHAPRFVPALARAAR